MPIMERAPHACWPWLAASALGVLGKRAGICLITGLAVACGGDESGLRTGVEIRDSAGVRIVENGEASGSGWQVGEVPLFTVGWSEDGPLFTWIQSGHILPDGGALVGDYEAGSVYRIGADGSSLGTWGRKGEGPGEYQGLGAILTLGDSILISDERQRRVTVLSKDDELKSTHPLPGASFHQVSTILGDGRALLVPGGSFHAVEETRPEWVFETQAILAADLAEGTVDTLAELPYLRRWYGTGGGSPGPVPVSGHAGGFAEAFAWARADRPEVRWFDGSGRLTQIARWREEALPLTTEARDAVIEAYEDAYQDMDESFAAAQLTRIKEELDLYEGPLPYWDAFHVDRQGNVWLSEHVSPSEVPDRWRVVTRKGTFIGWVDLPPAISILDITDDRILAVRLNGLDVPAVVMLELIKP